MVRVMCLQGRDEKRRTTQSAQRSPKFGTAFWQLREPCGGVVSESDGIVWEENGDEGAYVVVCAVARHFDFWMYGRREKLIV